MIKMLILRKSLKIFIFVIDLIEFISKEVLIKLFFLEVVFLELDII